MELVAQTASAVAVDDSLTTLIDWVNIEQVSGFTIIIENAGGGSANDITDIQIDTSPDGGVTVSTDQHDGVPAVPIASGAAKKGTFTETAAFVRVRGVCGSEEDTTANAWLMADSSVGRICTLADVKERLAISDNPDYDLMLTRIIRNLEAVFNGFTHRKLILNSADETVYLTGGEKRIILPRYPIVAITSIKQATDYDFASADALTANDAYRAINERGIIYRVGTVWLTVEDGIQVIYRGGYVAAGQTPGTGETAIPDDLREAAIEQTSFIFKRRDDIGLSGVGYDGGSISKFSAMKLLPLVEETLKHYRRSSL